MLAGHGGDAVTWLSDTIDGWVTSPVYSEAPVPAVKAFLDANPIDGRLRQDLGRRSLPAASLFGARRRRGRSAAAGMDAQLSRTC